MMRSRLMVAVAAGLMATVGAGAAVPVTAPKVTVNAPKGARQRLFGGYTMPAIRWSYARGGMTMAQQKRASIKKRNQRRHKAAGRK